MKRVLFWLFCLMAFTVSSRSQVAETFDIATFQAPKGWSKQAGQSSLQLSTEDKASGSYCLITLFKSLPGTSNSKENFDSAWQTVVKGMVDALPSPQMSPAGSDNGWEVQSGSAPFSKNGTTGVAMLVTATGYGKMVSSLILTNSQKYEQDISSFLGSIELEKPAASETPSGPMSQQPTQAAVSAGPYGFSSTRFDDGWTSTIQDDWVQVVKGNIRVLIHHPNNSADAYNSIVMESLRNAWNVLVSPRYSTAGNFEFKPITGWQVVEFAEADAVEKATGKTVHVVLFKMNYSSGAGRYMEFITPNKDVFEKEFGAYHETTSGWEKMENMAAYNKFGIAAADLRGKWTNDFSGSLSYINAYTGATSGTVTHASIENFQFGTGNAYTWDIGVASGYVGSIKFQTRKSNGRYSVPGIWQVAFSDIEGKPRTYEAWFSAVKGARILWLDGKAYGKLE